MTAACFVIRVKQGCQDLSALARRGMEVRQLKHSPSESVVRTGVKARKVVEYQ